MNASAIRKVTDKVAAKYPKMTGKSPKVSQQSEGTYLLVFKSDDALPNGKTISQILRVVADEDGNVKKMTSSKG